jgi:hypothetical protein
MTRVSLKGHPVGGSAEAVFRDRRADGELPGGQRVEQDAEGDGHADLGDRDVGELGEGGEDAGHDDAGGGDDTPGHAEPAQDAWPGADLPGLFPDPGAHEVNIQVPYGGLLIINKQ